jgi:hypothetical protein
LLQATSDYAKELAKNSGSAILADATGFTPEGVKSALVGLNQLENKLTPADWEPASLFGSTVQRQRALDTEGVKVVCSFD